MQRRGWQLVGSIVVAMGLLGMGLLGQGCMSTPSAEERLATAGKAGDILAKNLKATGELASWQGLGCLRAIALAGMANEQGGKTLVEQEHQFRMGGTPVVSVRSIEPGGVTVEELGRSGEVSLRYLSDGQSRQLDEEAVLRGTRAKLELLRLAVTGAYGVLASDAPFRWVGREMMEGQSTEVVDCLWDRKSITGAWPTGRFDGRVNRARLWFETGTGRLSRAWLCYFPSAGDAEAVYLAVTVNAPVRGPEGVGLPSLCEFSTSDAMYRIHGEPVYSVEYQQLSRCQQR